MTPGKYLGFSTHCVENVGEEIASGRISQKGLYDKINIGDYVIPNSVNNIEMYSIYFCHSMTSVTIPDSVTIIGEGAFKDCDGLTTVNISDSVIEITSDAFIDCNNLNSVYCKPTTPPTALTPYGFWWSFDLNAPDRKIYVPMESVEAYKSAEYWSDYADAIVGYDF
jgi:hypothetical protein